MADLCRPFFRYAIALAIPVQMRNLRLPVVKADRWGVETPFLQELGRQILEAGWHARMSSRFAGKGACACL